MENSSKPLNIQDYLAIGLRRKWCIIIPLVCAILVSFAVYKIMPKVYQASTLILVQPQKVPESYVRTTITSSITDRLNTIAQEILSRTKLEKVIQDLNLYADLKKTQPLEEIVARMRKAIRVNVQDRALSDRVQNTFSISFEGETPEIVMAVTNKLASLFIEENLKFREMQAENTSIFLSKELSSIEEQLAKKEEEVRKFRQRHMGQLPQQLEANLRILEQSQQQLKATSERIQAAEDRSSILQSQIEQLKRPEPPPLLQSASPREPAPSSQETTRERAPEDPIITQWNLLKRELEGAQSRYTENHPDIINLKIKITNIEPKAKEILQKQEALAEVHRRGTRPTGGGTSPERFPAGPGPVNTETQRLLTQYNEQYNTVLLEARRLRDEENKLKGQIHLYQVRIEETPKREQELLLLTRDYELVKNNYQSLMEKKIQSQMSENLERKQQGEQFRILDPGRIPEKAVRPDLKKVLLIGTMIGLVAGLGMAWLRETLDQSFHSEADLETRLGLPIMAIIPNLREEKKSV